jgi:hypothetical protein
MPSVHDLAADAGFVFEAVIQNFGEITTAGYTTSRPTAVVRITKIIKSTPALAKYEGQQVTVELQDPVSLAAGQSAVFFTEGVHYGEGVVVREVGNVPPQPELPSLVASAVQARGDNALTQRIAQAVLIISGVASAPAPYPGVVTTAAAGVAPSAVGFRPISEHDPMWWQAIVKVDSVEKGTHTGATKTILFPSSMDIAWYQVPKVKEGDRGVWLLHNRDVRGRSVPAHAIVHPLDFHPMEARERVRTLLRPPGQ